VGSMVKVVVPETPVVSTAVTVAVPAGAAPRACTPVNKPTLTPEATMVPSEVPVAVLDM